MADPIMEHKGKSAGRLNIITELNPEILPPNELPCCQ
jgi:hypothetical protein